jgi:hypothetical protein
MHPDYPRGLRDQCEAAGVSFYFKQWGKYIPYEHDAQPPFIYSQHGDLFDTHGLPDFNEHNPCQGWLLDGNLDLYRKVGKKKAGHLLDGVEHRPEF